jgi:hypothetical protein
MWVCSSRSTRNELMLIPMLHLLMISVITHMKEVVALLDLFLLWPQASILDNLAVLKISYRIFQMLWMVYNKHCCGSVCLIGIRGLEIISHLKMTYKVNRSPKAWSEDILRQLKGSNDLNHT